MAAAHRTITRAGVYGVGFLTKSAQFGMIAISVPLLVDRGVPIRYIGAVLGAAAVGSALAQLVVGKLVDRLGPWAASVAGCLTAAIGLALFAASGKSWEVMAIGEFIQSTGIAANGNSLRTAIALANRGTEEKAYGRFSAVQTAGSLFGPLLLGLIATDSTNVTPWFAAGCCAAAAAVGVAGGTGLRTAAQQGQGAQEDEASQAPSLRYVTGLIAPMALLVVAISASYGIYAVAWGILLHDHGASNSVIAWSFGVFSIPMMISSARVEKVLPKVDRRWVCSGAIVGLAAFAFAYAVMTEIWLIIGLSLIEGLVFGIAIPLVHSHIAETLPEGTHGRGFGVIGAADAVAMALGTGFAGVVIAYGGTPFAFRVGAGACLVAVAAGVAEFKRRDRAAARAAGTEAAAAQESLSEPVTTM